jgi:molybdopterin-biosynthesis enzyme MoeA-like protein
MTGPFHRILAAIHQFEERLNARLDAIEKKQNRALGMELSDARRDKEMAGNLGRLATEVSKNTDATESASRLLEELEQRIRDVAGDEQAANDLADELAKNNEKLAKAVAANTPAQPSGM